jgi:hypothetical protein
MAHALGTGRLLEVWRHPMKSFAKKLTAGGVVGLLAVAGVALAQSAFDSKRFFEELESRGANMPAAFDGEKFFEELQRRGYSSSNRLDTQRFFEELQSRGANMPANFDGKEFFEELSRRGVSMPQMVDMKK